MPADKEAKPRYNLHRQSDAYVMLRDGDHPMCSICVKKTCGLLDAQLILLACNSYPLTLQALRDIIASKTLQEAIGHANKTMYQMQNGTTSE